MNQTVRVHLDIEPLKQALDRLHAELDTHPVITEWATAQELVRFGDNPPEFFEFKQIPAGGTKETLIACQPTERFLKLLTALQASHVENGIGVEQVV